jgi:DNA-binding CsgD family transcriptional regulator
MIKVEDSSTSTNVILTVSETEYQQIAPIVIDSIAAVARTLYPSLYVIDYNRKDFLYVSDNPLFLCGCTSEEVRKMGYDFYLKYVPEEEQEMLTEINTVGFDFFGKLPVNEKAKCTITYDFHLVKGGKAMLINHTLTPILLNQEGRIWLAVCAVSLSSRSTSGHIALHITNQSDFWKYSLKNKLWTKHKRVILTEIEKKILALSSRGCNMQDIAEKIHVSLDTIKFHRKNIFKKTKAQSISEALLYAKNYRLI